MHNTSNHHSAFQSSASSTASNPFVDPNVVSSRPLYLAGPSPAVGQSLSQIYNGSSGSMAASVASESSSFFTMRRREIVNPIFHSPQLIKAGKRKIFISKWVFIAALVSCNTLFIFSTWHWSKYYYIFLPFITITAALNCAMVISVIFHTLLHRAIPEKEYIPDSPENLVLLLPCYNENKEECIHSLDSLVAQVKVDQHRKAIMIVCDGRVRGPDMEKTTADYLLDDILTHKTSREHVKAAYTAWDRTEMDVVVQKGIYGGIPYLCIIKEQNQGKRDSLIVARSFFYNFNIRLTKPAVIFSPHFFGLLSSFLYIDAGITHVDALIGMDADTVFAPDCIYELIKQSHYKDTVGVCGYVTVTDTPSSRWSPWILYQSSEYMISQCLRRLHQSIATHKVSCLPGCCQLLKICEATCGDQVLIELFGYYPSPTDNLLKQIRATASEDRNHVCLMLSVRPKSKTRQALKARAYTDVPRSWSVFLSQRRRWTLGATSNDLFLAFAPGVNWFERILALANVLTWSLNFFVVASIASFIKACTIAPYWIILAFASVMIFPIAYYVAIVIWQPRGVRERVQYLMGLAIYILLGAFLNISVLTYALWNVNNFSWGKTRKVVKEPEPETEKGTEIHLSEVENVIESESEKPVEVHRAAEVDNTTGSEEVGAPTEEGVGEGLVTVTVADLHIGDSHDRGHH